MGTPIFSRTSARIFNPSRRPGPRNDLIDVRLALSYEALKSNGTRQADVIFFSSEAMKITCSRLSTTQGPAMRKRSWERSIPKSGMERSEERRVGKERRG